MAQMAFVCMSLVVGAIFFPALLTSLQASCSHRSRLWHECRATQSSNSEFSLVFAAEDQRQAASSGHAEDHVCCVRIVRPCSFLHCIQPFHREKEQAAYHFHTIGQVRTTLALSPASEIACVPPGNADMCKPALLQTPPGADRCGHSKALPCGCTNTVSCLCKAKSHRPGAKHVAAAMLQPLCFTTPESQVNAACNVCRKFSSSPLAVFATRTPKESEAASTLLATRMGTDCAGNLGFRILDSW